MSIVKVAEIAGVSTATVSRVLNNSPKVSAATAKVVRRVMKETNFSRQRAPRRTQSVAHSRFHGKIAFLIFGASELREGRSGVFEELMHGISNAASAWGAELTFNFLPKNGELPQSIHPHNVDGLLLFGHLPDPGLRQRIEGFPTVWLMANVQRPTWGDQVMPDNLVIGEMAADYLVERGHLGLAYVSTNWWGWFWASRARSFMGRAQQHAAHATIVSGGKIDLPMSQREHRVPVDVIIDELLELEPRPTGLFVGEDEEVPKLVAALKQRGIRTGPGADMEIISCNHDLIHFVGMDYVPASIDIRAGVIGRRGVDLLRMRIENPGEDRIRTSVEPVLMPSEARAN